MSVSIFFSAAWPAASAFFDRRGSRLKGLAVVKAPPVRSGKSQCEKHDQTWYKPG